MISYHFIIFTINIIIIIAISLLSLLLQNELKKVRNGHFDWVKEVPSEQSEVLSKTDKSFVHNWLELYMVYHFWKLTRINNLTMIYVAELRSWMESFESLNP